MANSFQRNKQNFIYRNGCVKEVSEKINDRKNKELTDKGNNGVKGKPDIIDIIQRKGYNGVATSKGCQRREYQN
jgi:hypothetical protein